MDSTKLLSVKRKSEYNLTPEKPGFNWKPVLFILALGASLFLTIYFFVQDRHPSTGTPDHLPNVTPEMRTADFWISQIPDAGLVLRNTLETNAWNLLEAGEKGSIIYDLSEFNKLTTQAEIVKTLKQDFDGVAAMNLFDRNRNPVDDKDFARLEASQNRDVVLPTIPVQYGILIRDTNVRLLPTNEVFTKEPGDLEFDELQNSRGRAFSIIRILHSSKDQGWFYVQCSDVHGWVPIDDVAIVPTKRAAKTLSAPENFLMVLGDAVTVYSDPEMRIPFTQVRMGTKLTVISVSDKISSNYTVTIPIKGTGGMVDIATAYVKNTNDVRIGYLPFSRENILRQAFRLLGKPYGWGGMWKARDCSSFLQDVFLTVGVVLPRNSSAQANTGCYFVKFNNEKSKIPDSKKQAALDQAPPVTSLLRLNGHIMLYLGKVNGHYYAIHNSSGYRVPHLFSRDEVHKLNQVIVSDLSLGKGSKKKSLLERLISINTIA
ncbi:MAG: SH3 domain-containing protein [Candidatus Omnitrophica bacterium]|nr:SH3 domain-containing protein [Candidatus Omnitrophota bacterium]